MTSENNNLPIDQRIPINSTTGKQTTVKAPNRPQNDLGDTEAQPPSENRFYGQPEPTSIEIPAGSLNKLRCIVIDTAEGALHG